MLEFLNKTDDPEFLQSFNSQPGVLFKEYGITSYEVNVIVNASHKRFAPRDVQEKKVTSALKRLGIDPAQHAALVKKLVDNYNVAW
ncbi:hypothetical protein BE17_32265 [Sorangium cellulosum]|uniref:Uncharacterized protein n=1 Tax=Sorangium cellulosum TaxID=56 RepID=A0A150R191_SORCE|nr:hypothetical protein BE17_32265 [Sorangium cellulosum]